MISVKIFFYALCIAALTQSCTHKPGFPDKPRDVSKIAYEFFIRSCKEVKGFTKCIDEAGLEPSRLKEQIYDRKSFRQGYLELPTIAYSGMVDGKYPATVTLKPRLIQQPKPLAEVSIRSHGTPDSDMGESIQDYPLHFASGKADIEILSSTYFKLANGSTYIAGARLTISDWN